MNIFMEIYTRSIYVHIIYIPSPVGPPTNRECVRREIPVCYCHVACDCFALLFSFLISRFYFYAFFFFFFCFSRPPPPLRRHPSMTVWIHVLSSCRWCAVVLPFVLARPHYCCAAVSATTPFRAEAPFCGETTEHF